MAPRAPYLSLSMEFASSSLSSADWLALHLQAADSLVFGRGSQLSTISPRTWVIEFAR